MSREQFVCPVCHRIFHYLPTFNTHISRHPASAVETSQSVAAPLVRSSNFDAIRGDLLHRQELLTLFGAQTARYDFLVQNKVQADYLRQFEQSLIPPNNPSGDPPSDHTLGTVFEDNYFNSIVFRVNYLHRVVHLTF